MPINASIPLGYVAPQIDDPLTAQAKRLQLSDLVGRQQMQQMQLDDAKRVQAEQATLADLYRTSGADPQALIKGMAERGLGARIPAFMKDTAATSKLQNEAEGEKFKLMKLKLDAVGGVVSSLAANPNITHQDVISKITQLVSAGYATPQEGQQMVGELPSRPEALRSWLMQQGLQVMDASKRIEMLAGKTELQDMGGGRQAFTTNQLTGQVTPGASFDKSATPDAVMTDARTRAEGAANRGVTMRGQDMTAKTAANALAATKEKLENKDTKIKDANEAIDLINQAEPLLSGSTGSYGGLLVDKLGQFFGAATPGAVKAQQLKAIEGMLVSKMPKMSGPQSDKDVALYKQMAGLIGDETIPYAQKAAALKEVRSIQERYAGMEPGSSNTIRKQTGKVAPAPGGVVDWSSL